jgi:hypothetical protein
MINKELKRHENNLEELRKKNSSDFEKKRTQIISELDYLLNKEKDLLKNITAIEMAKRAFDSDNSLINSIVDENWGAKMDRAFLEEIREKEYAYFNEYNSFIFKIHELICSPNLYDKSMAHFNYCIPLSYDAEKHFVSSYSSKENIKDSNSIDTEFYQIGLLRTWSRFVYDKNFRLEYKDICNHFLNNFGNFHHSDIAVTKSSNGKSRVENSLDQIKRIFRKVEIIDKKNRLTKFGEFIIKIMDKSSDYGIGNPNDYRGIKGQSKNLAKPINDLIFKFDFNDFESLKISKDSFNELKYQTEKFKSDPKNVEIFNLPTYQRN